MKTQINSLQRGHGRLGIVGSSYSTRMDIAAKVVAENPEGMKVIANGHEYTLKRYKDAGAWYESEQLNTEQVRAIIPHDIKAIEHPELVKVYFEINSDMTCNYVTFRRKSINAKWKQGFTIEVAESNVTIL